MNPPRSPFSRFSDAALRFGILPYLALASLAAVATGTVSVLDGRAEFTAVDEPAVVVASTDASSANPLNRELESLDVCTLVECELGLEAGATEIPSTATPEPMPTAMAEPVPAPTPPPPKPVYTPPFAVPSRAVAVLEAPCGTLLYGKEEHASLPPASLTKIVTALAVVDRVNLSDPVSVEISAKDLKRRTRSSVMGLEPGMSVNVRDLLYGLFLPSGNDAALELAEHVSGDVEAFVRLMNEEAARLGLTDSNFSNPHGLDSPTLRSSAIDMARAGMAMMKNATLARISSTPSYTLEGGLHLRNGNRLLSQYPGASGVKIGYTNAAKHTIVASAARDGRELYVAVFGSENLYAETAALLDWAFAATANGCGH